jgi:16S rRNA (cytidine1402-2'-O)-methyltransferase
MSGTDKNVSTPAIYLIPTTLGDQSPQQVIPSWTLQVIKTLAHFVVEEERTARRFLIRAGIEKPLDSLHFHILNEHTPVDTQALIFKHADNEDIGLLSEAGAPAVADPGSDFIRLAHQSNYRIIPLVGPSSVILAVMASGLNGQNFAFCGYLPVKPYERAARIRFLEKRSQREKQSQVFIEAPYRNNQLIQAILDTCANSTSLCLAVNITLENEWIRTRTIAEWKENIPQLHKQPAVFILQG